MIYLHFSEMVREMQGYPEFVCVDKNTKFADLMFSERALADSIFEFKDGETVYMKNRHNAIPNGYQYSEEEQLVIALKAVPL